MQFTNKLKTKKLSNYRANSLSRGAVALMTTLVISAVILMIAVFGSIIATISLSSANSERLITDALLAARSGAQDGIMRVVKDKNCPIPEVRQGQPSCFGEYTLDVNDSSVTINISDDTPELGMMTISSTGESFSNKKKIEAIVEVDETTGKVRIQSFKEVPID